ncbi:hypothetical protein [Evansella cellulosilytica]|uniref:Uncharacterized protein n=1 Tax=Evansella cellulosilytica (strain ATCC 21833 / DSM 2522 / FERM P-1141 / JCM 9156 / N-4) TaxID=649639 RepID=E6U1H1_EVAC2|nr:hypothetical protein [Evansella cellulosilytica]ADU29218.1 hypothetical protein Bcell_0942 [Evansella cellulosilytica DSM 2522]
MLKKIAKSSLISVVVIFLLMYIWNEFIPKKTSYGEVISEQFSTTEFNFLDIEHHEYEDDELGNTTARISVSEEFFFEAVDAIINDPSDMELQTRRHTEFDIEYSFYLFTEDYRHIGIHLNEENILIYIRSGEEELYQHYTVLNDNTLYSWIESEFENLGPVIRARK